MIVKVIGLSGQPIGPLDRLRTGVLLACTIPGYRRDLFRIGTISGMDTGTGIEG